MNSVENRGRMFNNSNGRALIERNGSRVWIRWKTIAVGSHHVVTLDPIIEWNVPLVSAMFCRERRSLRRLISVCKDVFN